MIKIGNLKMILEFQVVCEGAGAISVAAMISEQLNELKGKKVVAILTGGNIDSSALGR